MYTHIKPQPPLKTEITNVLDVKSLPEGLSGGVIMLFSTI